MQPVFLTSFARDLYDATGRRLVDSFCERQQEGWLFCAYEGFQFRERPPHVLGIDITDDPWMAEWDARYRATSEACRENPRLDPEARLWRGRAWQWFRKAVALRRAVTLAPRAFLVWLDCDVEFRANLTWTRLREVLGEAGIGYHRGTRRWTETGVVVYDLRHQKVHEFLAEVFAVYESGRFLELERWDDCWIFDRTRERFPPDLFVDLTPAVKLQVVEQGRLGSWLTHKKGFHSRQRIR